MAVSDARKHRSSDLQLLPVSTKDITPPTFLTAPVASDIGESSFTLTVSLSESGKELTFAQNCMATAKKASALATANPGYLQMRPTLHSTCNLQVIA